ncbi:uncharacterized protein LOC106639897 [Copidosoma floridanum]|uniref:uncharacterized protein LOC106639897 n=1 Tax=Copidosoma floridanum TaxID=29053 RepID=UPI0006C9D399|nr:uncharacterized protein LOC106639897 [Copidosoma floridanum]XP_014209196.1 uncharacterized protein LOC106639897 [Copidosoma floridanum]XP_014209197.1 uncharacterized protein LOC106639897 [Copidosoma floridanum]
MASQKLKGWRFAMFIGGFVGAVLTPFYFTAIQPFMDSSHYKQIREHTGHQLRPKSF